MRGFGRFVNSWLKAVGRGALLSLLFSSPMPAEAADKTVSLRYEVSVGDPTVFPDGCQNPYRDLHLFTEFFESTLDSIVIERGTHVKGLADLYAVSELRAQMKEIFPNLSEESPLDRLILTQLCQFQKIYLQTTSPGTLRPQALHSANKDLHDHLLAVGPKLFRDSRKIMVDGLTQRAKLREKAKKLAARRAEIRRAREAGRALVDDLFAPDRP